jgi:hypothetical protein
MVRPSYRANFTSGTRDSTNLGADPFFGLVFDPTEPNFSGPVNYDRDDLLGGFPTPRRYIGWQTFSDFGDGQVKNNKKVDTTISSVLFTLSVPPTPRPRRWSSLRRNLLRQLTWGLTSGQAAAFAAASLPTPDRSTAGPASTKRNSSLSVASLTDSPTPKWLPNSSFHHTPSAPTSATPSANSVSTRESSSPESCSLTNLLKG